MTIESDPVQRPKVAPLAEAVAAAPEGTRVHPRHLVIFRRPSKSNRDVLRGVLKAQDSGRVGARGVSHLLRLPSGADVSMLERTGIATATLTDDQIAGLRKADDVVAEVVLNERRTIPKPIPTPPSLSPSTSVVAGSAPVDALVAYLRGVIDASENTLRFLGRHPADAAPARAPGATVLAMSESSLTWALQSIGLTSQSTLTGKGVTVAVLDTGVDLGHPDLKQHFTTGATTACFVPGVSSAQDGNGHGTHCAGVIAGAIQPLQGPRYSVAPDVTLLAGKVLDDAGSGFDDNIINGIEWAANAGAQVISMSLGGARAPGSPYSSLYERIGSALLEQGILLVAAAGNESHRPADVAPLGNPAACPSFLAVAAVDVNGQLGWFSSGASDGIGAVAITGPGVGVLSAWTGGGYQLETGTSMAAPHVAGAAALWIQSTRLSGSQLWAQMRGVARKLDSPAGDVGAGLVRTP